MKTPETVTCPMRRFRGRTISEIAAENPDFLEWARNATDWGYENADLIEQVLALEIQPAPPRGENDEKTSHERSVEEAARVTCPMKKFRDYSIVEIAAEEPGYLRWAQANTDWGHENRTLIAAALLQSSLDKIAERPSLTLTEHQQSVVDHLSGGYRMGYKVLRLLGGAGYGKSYSVEGLARFFIEDGFQIHACAVSYVATEVLRKQLEPIGVSCATVARTLKFDKKWVDGQEVYEHSDLTEEAAREVLRGKNALIVDECSMINDRDASLLFKTVLDCDPAEAGVLILVGDRNQLPPVKQNTPSICCTYTNPAHVVSAQLTVPMRYSADSHLYAVEQMARTNPRGLLDGHTVANRVSAQVTETGSVEDMIDEYVRNFRYDPAANHRMLLFRRRDVVNANNRIRYKIFGEDVEVVEEAEQLMVLSTTDYPHRRPGLGVSASVKNTRYYSGTIYRVDEVEQGEYRIRIGKETFEIPHYRVRFTDSPGWVSIIFGITEDQADVSKTGGAEYEAAVKAAIAYGRLTDEYGVAIGDWEPLRQLKGDFLLVAYTYATSVHRCQGQTLDYAYTVPGSLLGVRAPMGPALTYVACTRAKKHLTIVR